MKRKILVFALLLSLVITLIPTTASMFGTASASPDAGWTLVTNARAMKAYPALREYVWQKNASMEPNGLYDKIGLHRVVNSGAKLMGVVFVVPGLYGNGESLVSNPPSDVFAKTEDRSSCLYWANRGFDVYTIDFRSHFIPVNFNKSQLAFTADWGMEQVMSDIKEAVDKAKEISGEQKVFMAGPSWGGILAQIYAARYWQQDIQGLILLDPAPPKSTLTKNQNLTNSYNLTTAVNTMKNLGAWTWENPQSSAVPSPLNPGYLFLVQFAAQNPSAPAQYPNGTLITTINPRTNKTWANITEYLEYGFNIANFFNTYGGYSNITYNINMATQADRYFPVRQFLDYAAMLDWTVCPYVPYDYLAHVNEVNVPVLAFRSGLNLAAYGNITNGMATTDFIWTVLPNYGHGDVFYGTYSARDVSEPALEWMVNHTTVFSSGFEDRFNSWSTTYGGVSVVSSPVYFGNYSMKCSDPWGSLAAKTIGQQSETYTSAEFRFDQNVAGDETLIGYRNWAGNPIASMGISVQSGRVFVFVQTMLPSYSYSQYELPGFTPGTWYKFGLDVSATSAKIYVNDKQVASLSQTNIPATDKVNVGMFWGNGAYTGNLYIDDAQIGVLPPLALPAGAVRNYWTGGTGTVAVPSSTWPTGGLHEDSLMIYAQHVEGGTYGTGDSITVFVPYQPPFGFLPMACFCTNAAEASFEKALRSGTPAGSNTWAVSGNDLKVGRNGNSVTVELKTQQTIKWMKNASATGGTVDVIIPAFTMKLDTVGDSTHTNTVVQLAGFAGASGYTVYDDNMRFNANGAFTCADWNYAAVPMTNCIFVMHGINTNVPS